MSFEERALGFACGDARLVAVASVPAQPIPRGVLVVVGGPQYRAGSHRQFTLLCRGLAERGIAAMRFDYRGMGDSEGATRSFEDVQPDIRAAIDEFCIQVPELREVAIWGLCDAASAALFYAHQDARVTRLVLLNPWVRTATGIAKARLKHYYWSRFTDRALWRKLARGEFSVVAAARSFAGTVLEAFRVRKVRSPGAAAPLPDRMAEGLERFRGKLLLILSGRDLTAQEFVDTTRASSRWEKSLSDSRIERRDLPDADHTFSRRQWRDQVATWTADWVRSS